MKSKNDQYRKIAAKISSFKEKAIIGITSADEDFSSSEISYKLAKVMSENKKVFYIDLDNDFANDEEFANINLLYRKEETIKKDGNLFRLNFTKSDDVAMILESKDFENFFMSIKDDCDYIIINEKSYKYSQAYLAAKFEDCKIFVVNEDETDKNILKASIGEFEDMGIEILGVIYNK